MSPAQNTVTLEWSLPNAENGSARVVDLLGHPVWEGALQGQAGSLQLDTSTWTAGMYGCSFFVEEAIVETRTLMIQRD
jgi:hypothetical protein